MKSSWGAGKNEKLKFLHNKKILQNLKEKKYRLHRETSYMSWAQSEFKINSVSSQNSERIKNETDFILKVRNKHIRQRNLRNTIIIQKWWRMKMT